MAIKLYDGTKSEDRVKKHLNGLYRNDPFVMALSSGVGKAYDEVSESMTDLFKQYDLEAVTWGIGLWEKLLDFKTDDTKAIEDRRSALRARWQSDGKIDALSIQRICDNWKNGEIQVDFVEGSVVLKFVGAYGVPVDLEGLLAAVNDVKPAHLAMDYLIKYVLIKDVIKLKVNGLLVTKIGAFAFNREENFYV